MRWGPELTRRLRATTPIIPTIGVSGHPGAVHHGAVSRTLFVTDLDGTFLDPTGRLRQYSRDVVRRARQRQFLVTVATARSWTSTRRLVGTTFDLPMVVHDGAAIVHPIDGAVMTSSTLDSADVTVVLQGCRQTGAAPLVHTLRHGVELTSWLPEAASEHVRQFWQDRGADPRSAPKRSWSQLPRDDVLGIAVVAEPARVERLREALPDLPGVCVSVREDTYRRGPLWLSVTADGVSKGAAIRQLAEELKVNRIVAFGDNANDMSLFAVADEALAVANADSMIRAAATAVIGSNADEAVARWLATELALDC